MYERLYTSFHETIKSGNLGDVKIVRINVSYPLKNANKENLFDTYMYQPLLFITEQLGEIKEIYAKSKDYTSTLIIAKHSNNQISHIALNMGDIFTNNIQFEVVGNKGIAEYDSEKNMAIMLKKNNELSECLQLNEPCCKDYTNKKVLDIIKTIKSKINGGDL